MKFNIDNQTLFSKGSRGPLICRVFFCAGGNEGRGGPKSLSGTRFVGPHPIELLQVQLLPSAFFANSGGVA
jgi:hypothetical protein